MKVELLLVPECPNQVPSRMLISEALTAEGLQAEVKEVVVADEAAARALRFPGSPTIRINGEDVEGFTESSGTLSCRMYARADGKLSGVPSIDAMRRALRQGRE